MRHRVSLLLLLLFHLVSIKAFSQHVAPHVYAIQDVHVIPMTGNGGVIKHATVIVQGNKIISTDKKDIPAGAKVINGKGKWLIPGLMDMHVHGLADVNFKQKYPTQGATVFADVQDVMLPYVACGVTTIFELSARVEHFAQRNDIERGDVTGPRMALAALIEGEGSGRVATNAAEGRLAVRLAKADGYEFVKVYAHLNEEAYKAIVDEAAKQGMKVVGHIPNVFKGKIEEVFVPNFGMVAHAEELAKHTTTYSDEDAIRFAELMKANGTWLTATLIVMQRAADQGRSLDSVLRQPAFKYVHPLIQDKWLTANNYHKGANAESIARLENIIAFNKKLVKACRQIGVPIVAGTDAGSSGVIWGYALHDELQLLTDAGMTPAEVLASATRLPAQWLGIDSLVGTIEAGKFADMILLDANPLEDIRNTTKIADVCFNGRWIDKATIDKMLAGLARRNETNKGRYEWKKRKEY